MKEDITCTSGNFIIVIALLHQNCIYQISERTIKSTTYSRSTKQRSDIYKRKIYKYLQSKQRSANKLLSETLLRCRGIFRKRCSENIQQLYKRISMPKCDFNKVAFQLHWNHTSAWLFFCKFVAHFQNNFS